MIDVMGLSFLVVAFLASLFSAYSYGMAKGIRVTTNYFAPGTFPKEKGKL